MRMLSVLPETSAAQGLSACNKCGVCCRVSPCLLVPKDVKEICRYLNVSVGEFVKTLLVERTQKGQWQVRMKGPCAYLKENECSIHPVKPRGGKDFRCWAPSDTTYYWSEEALAKLGFVVP